MKKCYLPGLRPRQKPFAAPLLLLTGFLFCWASPLSALSYYWVNGNGAWSQFATHWAKIPNPTLPAHYHANVPTADDDVYFGDTNGGAAYTVNVDAGSTVPKCRNMDWTGVPAGTVWGGGGGQIDIYGSVTLSASMSTTYFGQIHLVTNDATTKTITSNTIHFSCAVYFEGSMGGWQLGDEFYCDLDVNHSGGLLETMGQKVTIGSYFTGNYVALQNGTLHLGSSEVNVGGSFLVRYLPSQFNAGTSHIKMLNANQFFSGYDYLGYDLHFYDVSFLSDYDSGGFGWASIDGTLTFYGRGRIHAYSFSNVPMLNNVVFHQNAHIYNAVNYKHLTLTAGKTYTFEDYGGTTGTDQTILPGGTLTAMGAGTCSQFITIKSWQYGTHFNLVNNSGTQQTVHCAILEDCHATGTDPLEVLDGVNLGNNTGWIFTAPNPGLDLYWVGGAGDWNDPCHWTSNPLSLVGDCDCIPNGASNVHFTANSGFSPGGQVTVPVDAYCANMDWTGVTGMPEISHPVGGPSTLHIYGSFKLDAGMNFNFGGWVRFRASSNATITSAGEEFIYKVVFEGTGTWELQDAFEAVDYEIYHRRGTFKSLGNSMRVNYWCGNLREDATTVVNMGAVLWLGEVSGSSSTVSLVKSTVSNVKGHFLCWYEAGKFHAVESHIIGLSGGYIDCQPNIFHDFWDVTFNPIDHAGDFLYGNILNKLTFLAFGNLAGPNTHIHEVEFHKGAYLFDSHTYDILTIHGGHNFKFQPYTSTGSTVQTIKAGGIFNHINTSCEYPTVMHNPTPGETTTFRKEGAGTAFDIQHTIFDRVYADQTSGAIYTATNCVAIQPDVEASWNMTNPAPRDLYWVGGAGDWHSAAHWSLASGGAGGECPPTAHDDVFFNAASGLGAGDAVTVNQSFAFCKDMDWTGVGSGAVLNNTNTSFNQGDPFSINSLSIFGSLKFSSAMTNNFIGSVWLRAKTPATITSAGQHFKNSLYFYEPVGDWTLADPLVTEGNLLHPYGILRTNDQMVTLEGARWYSGLLENSTELFLGNSTVRFIPLYSYSPVEAVFTYPAGKFHGGTSHVIFEDGAPGNRIYATYSTTEFYNLTFKNPDASLGGGSVRNKLVFEKSGSIGPHLYGGADNYIHEAEFHGDFIFGDSRPYHSMKFAPGKRYTFASNTTQTIVPHAGTEGQFIAQGLPGQYIEMKSSDPNTQAIIHKDDYDGTSTCTKYLFLTGMKHTGTEDIYVPTPGGNVFNNSGWLFFPCNPCPATIPVLAANSITVGCAPGKAKLVLDGLKPDEWAIWYTDPAATTNIVYNGGTTGPAGNLFEPVITGPVTYYARVYSDGGLCESTVILAVDITNNTPPTGVFNTTGGGTVCAGSNGTLVGLDGSEPGVTYELHRDGLPTGTTMVGTGFALSFGLQTLAGAYTVVATPTGTSCPRTMNLTAVIVGNASQAPAVAASSNAPVCEHDGNGLLLFESGNAATSWAWTGPNGYTSTDQNPVILNPLLSYSGIYTVVVSDGLGCTNIASVNVAVLPLPSVHVLSNDPVCGGSLTLFEIQGEAVYWTWYGPNGYIGTSNTPSITLNNVSPADDGFYDVEGLGANGCVAYASVQVSVKTAKAGPLSGDMRVCPGQKTTLTPLGTQGGTWSSSNPAIATINSLTGEVSGITPGNTTITYSVLVGNCVQVSDTIVRVWPRPAVAVTGDDEVCENETLTLTETGGEATAWKWMSGTNQTVSTDKILSDPAPTNAQYNGVAVVIVTDGRGCTNAMTVDVIVYTPPASAASSNAPFCAGTDNLYLTESGGAQAFSWAWSGPNGYTSTQQNPVIVNPSSGVYTVKVTDWNGCTSESQVTASIHPLPTVTCPPTVFVKLSDPAFSLSGATPSGGMYVGPNVVNGNFDPSAAGLGNHPVTYGYTDGNGCDNECGFTVSVQSGNPPTIICPPNIVRNTDPGLCSAIVTYPQPNFTAEALPATLTLVSGPASGSAFQKGATMLNWKVTDALARMAVCDFTVTVNDNQAPNISCPANIVRNTDVGRCDAMVTYPTPTATDNCPGVTVMRTSPVGTASGSLFPKGTTPVTWEASDAATPVPNKKSCTFTVTVNDVQAPSITCPANLVNGTDPNACTAAVTYAEPSVADNCPGVIRSLQSGVPSGGLFPKGQTTVVWRATDGAGLTKTCSFRVTVNDVQVPSIICPASVVKYAVTNLCSATATYTTPTVSDNCGGGLVTRILGLASGSVFPVGANVVVWRAIDASGLSKTCSFTVSVSDVQPPSITCPNSITAPTDLDKCTAEVPYVNPVGTDNCAGAVTFLHVGLASGSVFPLGSTTVVWKVLDLAGLSNTCSFVVTVQDMQAPAITCPPSTTVNSTGSPCGYPAANLPVATAAPDNCSITTLTHNAPPTLSPGIHSIMWTASDVAGNASPCVHTVTVNCPTAPSVGSGTMPAHNRFLQEQLGLHIAPNPANFVTTFTVSGLSGAGELRVFDPLGRTVWRQVVTGEQPQVQLEVSREQLAAGVYQVRLQTEQGSVTKTLMVSRL